MLKESIASIVIQVAEENIYKNLYNQVYRAFIISIKFELNKEVKYFIDDMHNLYANC